MNIKKIILIIIIVIIAIVSYWLISPIFIDKKVDEKLEDIINISSSSLSQKDTPSSLLATSSDIIYEGIFNGLDGHNAQGKVIIVKIDGKQYLRLNDDFRVTNGPDLFIHFGKEGVYDPSAKVAQLKGNIGGQNYEISSEINPDDYNEVWIWCRAFSVAFGKAVLK